MTEVAVIVPVLGRPQNARPLVESVLTATACDWELVFVCTPGDTAQIAACDDLALFDQVEVLVADWPADAGDYARKINLAFELTDAPFVLCGADDLRFHAGWDTAALAVAREYDVGVVGTNDLGNSQVVAGQHSTHPLVARCYIDGLGGTFDERPGVVYSDAYSHQCVDTELVELAKARGCYAHAPRSVVEHLHPLWGKAEMGDTYRRALADGASDRELFARRQRAWQRVPV